MSARRDWRALVRLAIRSAGILVAVAFVALLIYGIVARSPRTTIDDALADAHAPPAPGFELDTLQDGDPGPLSAAWGRAAADGNVDLAELRGTPVVLNYWASWCVPCRDEAPLLQQGWLGSRGAGVLFLGLDMQDATEDARVFIREFGLTFPHVRDGTNRTARRWGVTGIPETHQQAGPHRRPCHRRARRGPARSGHRRRPGRPAPHRRAGGRPSFDAVRCAVSCAAAGSARRRAALPRRGPPAQPP